MASFRVVPTCLGRQVSITADSGKRTNPIVIVTVVVWGNEQWKGKHIRAWCDNQADTGKGVKMAYSSQKLENFFRDDSYVLCVEPAIP